MRQLVVQRGELRRERIARGALSPNGQRAHVAHWAYLPGPAMLARLGAPGSPPRSDQSGSSRSPQAAPIAARPRALPAGEFVRTPRTKSPPKQDNLSADRSLDLKDKDLTKLPGALDDDAPPQCADEKPASFDCPPQPSRPRDPDTLALARGIALHYANRTGRCWSTIEPSVIDLLAPFVERMIGSSDAKLARVCALIDGVVAHVQEATGKPPTLRYVFHPQIFWRRLERLGRPVALSPPVGPSPFPLRSAAPETSRASRAADAPRSDCLPLCPSPLAPRAKRLVVPAPNPDAQRAARAALEALGWSKPEPRKHDDTPTEPNSDGALDSPTRAGDGLGAPPPAAIEGERRASASTLECVLVTPTDAAAPVATPCLREAARSSAGVGALKRETKPSLPLHDHAAAPRSRERTRVSRAGVASSLRRRAPLARSRGPPPSAAGATHLVGHGIGRHVSFEGGQRHFPPEAEIGFVGLVLTLARKADEMPARNT